MFSLHTCAEIAASEQDRSVYPDSTFTLGDKLLHLLEHHEALGVEFGATRAGLLQFASRLLA